MQSMSVFLDVATFADFLKNSRNQKPLSCKKSHFKSFQSAAYKYFCSVISDVN